MASQEFLASFAVDIDEAGVSRLQQVLEENRELADSLAAAFNAAAAAIQSFADELGVLPGFSAGGTVTEGMSGLSGLALGLDTSAAEADLVSLINLVKTPLPLSANASGIVSAARSAYGSVKSLFSQPIPITAKVETEGGEGAGDGGGPILKMSAGGRFSRPTDVQVAEDGDAEYIIPVKKESRAVPLLKQLLAELSPAARASLSLGDGASSLISGGIAAGQPAGAQITQNNSNVSAPVTIQVRSTGANAEQIGQKLYDTAERYLLRTLQGAMA
ncbi:MAG: hypothetical protein IJI09_05345 [Clostridia bacterium]|nr:hypothetical protein [Clostridia bacterium]